MAVSESAQSPPVLTGTPHAVSWWKTIVVLFKLRVVSLLLLSSFGGAAAAILAGGKPSLANFLLLAITGTLAAAGASAINQALEMDQDGLMGRTAGRPLVTGNIQSPGRVIATGGGLISAAVGGALLAGNESLGFWLLAGAIIYVAVYTVWLKPRTTLNIVIGGAAGSCAVISGGAAVGAPMAPGVWLLAALVFCWTPVHFWALALAYRDEYATAGYPMLPAVVSPGRAAGWTALHTLLTAGFGLSLALIDGIDWPLLIIIGLTTIPLLQKTVSLLNNPGRSTAFPLFTTSNLYLTILLLAVMCSLLWR